MIWTNGPFGVDKTTTGNALVDTSERLRLFDAEWIGDMLMNNLQDHGFTARIDADPDGTDIRKSAIVASCPPNEPLPNRS